MAAPRPHPPRNWWPVEIPGVIGSIHRMGLWVGSRPSQAGRPSAPNLSGQGKVLVSVVCVTGVAAGAGVDVTPWVDWRHGRSAHPPRHPDVADRRSHPRGGPSRRGRGSPPPSRPPSPLDELRRSRGGREHPPRSLRRLTRSRTTSQATAATASVSALMDILAWCVMGLLAGRLARRAVGRRSGGVWRRSPSASSAPSSPAASKLATGEELDTFDQARPRLGVRGLHRGHRAPAGPRSRQWWEAPTRVGCRHV